MTQTVDFGPLVEAHAGYPSLDAGDYYDEVLQEVQERVEAAGAIGKADIGALMLWKRLNLNTLWARELNSWPDSAVRQITAQAFSSARDTTLSIPEAARTARVALLDLPGCKRGAAVASTLLTACAPTRMAVYDRRAAAALVALGYPHPRDYYSRYMESVCALAASVNEDHALDWGVRDVDKALFVLGGSPSS